MAGKYEPTKKEANEPPSLGRFVRLKLTDEIVEVKQWASNSLTIEFKGQSITLRHDEVRHLPPEEQSVYEQHLNQQRFQR
jgi:hypothetical protein